MAIKTITVDGITYDIGVTVTNIEGTLPVSKGGTGVTSTPSLLTNLESTSASNPFASTPRPGVTGTLPISRGGTGATTAAAAKAALGIEDTDTKVNQTTTTVTNIAYPLLASGHAGRSAWTNGAYEAQVHPLVTLNAGNAKMSIGAHITGTGVADGSGYNLWENTNEKFYGSLHYGRLWASSTTPGLAILSLGNNFAAATTGSASGEIDLYSTTQYCAKIVYSETASASREYTIPNVAASDFVMTAGNQSISGTKSFNGQVNFAGGTTYNVSTTGTGTFNSLEAKGNLYADQKIIGKSGTVSNGNYTTTVPTAAGTTGQMMFVLQ